MTQVTTTHTFDDQAANRVVKRIHGLRDYQRRVEAWAATEMNRAQKQEQRLLQYFTPHLEAFARQRLGNSRRRSIALPGGTISLRRQPVRPTVIDEAEVLAWCRDHLPDAVQLDVHVAGPAIITLRQWLEQSGCDADTEEKLRRKVINDHVKVSGELLPGMDMGGGGDERLYIS